MKNYFFKAVVMVCMIIMLAIPCFAGNEGKQTLSSHPALQPLSALLSWDNDNWIPTYRNHGAAFGMANPFKIIPAAPSENAMFSHDINRRFYKNIKPLRDVSAAGKKILFISDANPFHSEWYGFSSLGYLLTNIGFDVYYNTASGNITDELLADYDVAVYFIGSTNALEDSRVITDSEADSLIHFADNGKGLFIVGELVSENSQYSIALNNAINKLATHFGITVRAGMVCDPTNHYNDSYDNDGGVECPFITNINQAHPVTEGVSTFMINWGAPLTVNSPAIALAYSDDDSWCDLNSAWNSSNERWDTYWNDGEEIGSFPVLAAAETSEGGRVVAIGDDGWMVNYWIDYYDHSLLAENIFMWLSGSANQNIGLEIVDPQPRSNDKSFFESFYKQSESQQSLYNNLSSGGKDVSTAVADGVTKLLLRVNVPMHGKVYFDIDGSDPGFLSPLMKESGGWTNKGTTYTANTVDTPSGIKAFAVYTVPQNFTTKAYDYSVSRTISIGVAFSENDGVKSRPIKIIRPPLVLVHGLWSDSSVFEDFKKRIENKITKAADLYIKTIDYKNTHASEFDINLPIIKRGVDNIIESLRSQNNIAITQVDYVGHSMGGILGRLVIENDKTDRNYQTGTIHKFITIDTPHMGSFLANQLNAIRLSWDQNSTLIVEFLNVIDKSINSGAIEDLQECGSAVKSLETINKPSHAIVGVYTTEIDLNKAFLWCRFLKYLNGKGCEYDIEAEGDLVVSEKSQIGGLTQTAFEIFDHAHMEFDIPPFGAATFSWDASPLVTDKVVELMNADSADNIFAYFPAVSSLCNSYNSNYSDNTPQSVWNDRLKNKLNATAENKGITILSPADQSQVSPGITISVSIGTYGGLILDRGLIVGKANYLEMKSPNLSGTITIPDNVAGAYKIIAFGVDAQGNVYQSETVTLNVSQAAALSQLVAQPESIYCGIGDTFYLSITGSYSDGIDRNITLSTAGTSYTSSESSVATVSLDGLVTAIGEGLAMIRVENSNLFINVPIQVLKGSTTTTSRPAMTTTTTTQGVGTSSTTTGPIDTTSPTIGAITASNCSITIECYDNKALDLENTKVAVYDNNGNEITSTLPPPTLTGDGTAAGSISFTNVQVGLYTLDIVAKDTAGNITTGQKPANVTTCTIVGPTTTTSTISGTTQYKLDVVFSYWDSDQGTVTISSPNGDVVCNYDCYDNMYNAGTVVTLTAVPGENWNFDGWYVDVNSEACQGTAPCTITINSDTYVNVYFSYKYGCPPLEPVCIGNGGWCCLEAYPYCGWNGGCYSTPFNFDCPISFTLGDQSNEISILRDFRDKVLHNSEAGKELTDIYYKHAVELTGILVDNHDISRHVVTVLLDMLPSIKAMVEGYPMIIDSATVKQVNTLFKKILPKASPELKKVIESIEKKLNNGTLLNEIEKTKTESCD